MHALRRIPAHVLRTALLALSLTAVVPPVLAQQARQQPAAPAATRPDLGTACFTGADPAQIMAACDVVLRAAAGTYTSDQTGFALQRRGGARAALGRVDDAIADFKQMVTTGYKLHEAYASIASLEFQRQRLKEAETNYREALKVNPSYALALLGLGHTLIGLGRPAEAIPHFDRALATADTDPAVHLGKGSALAAIGDADGAVKSLDAALGLDPRLLPALYQRAQLRYDKGDVTRALQDADAAVSVATNEEKVRALIYRGRLRNSAKNFDGAIADCTQADAEAQRITSIDASTRAAASTCIGLARQSKGELAEAQRSYDNALRFDPRDVSALSGRGYVVLQRGRFDAAIADFQAALQIDPRSQDALRFLGLTYSDKGDRASAERAFQRAIEVDPKDPWPIMIRAITAARDGEKERALADAAKALELVGPQSSDGFLVRSAVNYFLEDVDKARTDVDNAIRLNAENGQAYRMLARLLLRSGQLDEAQKALVTSARLLPNDATVLLERGLVALARRDWAAAQRDLTESLGINDAYSEVLWARGQALEGLGNKPAAIADYRAAETKLAIDPDGRRAKAAARERLAVLTGAVRTPPSTPAQSGPAGAASTPTDSPTSRQTGQNVPSQGRSGSDASAYCRLVEGVFVHSRRYTGVEFDVGCKPQN